MLFPPFVTTIYLLGYRSSLLVRPSSAFRPPFVRLSFAFRSPLVPLVSYIRIRVFGIYFGELRSRTCLPDPLLLLTVDGGDGYVALGATMAKSGRNIATVPSSRTRGKNHQQRSGTT